MPLCVLCLCVCVCLVAYGRALTAPTPGLTLLMPPGVPDLCSAGTPTPAVIWSRCQIPPLHPSTASPLSRQALLRSSLYAEASLCFSCCHSFVSVNTTYRASPFILSPPTNSPRVLWAPASCLSEFLRASLILESCVLTHPFPFVHFHLILSVCSPHHHTMSDKRPRRQSHVCLPGQHGLDFSSHKAGCQEGKNVFYYNWIQK